MYLQIFRHCGIDQSFRNLRTVHNDRCRRWSWPMTVPDATSSAANNEVVPWRQHSHGSSSFRLPWLHGNVPAGCGQVLEFATFRRHKAPALARADSSKARTTSRTFSTSRGSFESLKVSERCGWRPKDRQMRADSVIGLSPDRFAILSGAPVCGSLRLALQRQGDHLLHLLVRNACEAHRVTGLIQQSIDSKGDES